MIISHFYVLEELVAMACGGRKKQIRKKKKKEKKKKKLKQQEEEEDGLSTEVLVRGGMYDYNRAKQK